jgi:hypothetical protein
MRVICSICKQEYKKGKEHDCTISDITKWHDEMRKNGQV